MMVDEKQCHINNKKMVYIRIKYAEEKELLANPNCPVRVLYNFIKQSRSEAGADKIILQRGSDETGDSLLPHHGKKSSSQGTLGSHGSRQTSHRKNIHNSSKTMQQSSKTSTEVIAVKSPTETTLDSLDPTKSASLKISPVSDTSVNSSQMTVTETLLDEREFDLCDENGQLKYIYDMHPWVNGFETGIFLDHAHYIVVLFERDENGLVHKPTPVLSRTGRVYSDLMIKIRRQLSITSKLKLRGDKEKSATAISSKPHLKLTSNPSLTSSF